MVRTAAADPPWPDLSPQVAELFRQGAQLLLDPRADWVEELHEASLSSERMRPIAEDPVLAANTRRANLANLLQWATANVQQPGRRVRVNTSQEVLDVARDMVRRGFDERGLDAYRTTQAVAWRRWMQICFGLTDDPDLLRELLDVSALSITTFIDDTVTEVSARMEAERAELTRGASAERRAAVTLLLEGAPISRARAEAQLGYALAGPHTAAVIWSTGPGAQPERVAEAVVRAAGAPRRLTVVADAATLWVWFPGAVVPSADALAAAAAGHPDVQVALGRPGTGIEGFRRSHLDAAATQRVLTRLTSPQQVARFADVQLVALLTSDPGQAEEFVRDALGALRDAEPVVRETVLAFVHAQGSTTLTAERLFTHRNTVLRRLTRADELLPRPLAENVLAVGAALEVLRLTGG